MFAQLIRYLALPALAYVALAYVRIEKYISTSKAQWSSRSENCNARCKLVSKNSTTGSLNHTNIRIIAAHLGLGDELET